MGDQFVEDLVPHDAHVLLHRIAAQLAEKFVGIFAAETVERYVFESYTALYRTAKVRRYLAVTAERFALDRLTALAQARGAIPKAVPEVLFICVHNAGRSQMAAALLSHHGAGRVAVRSAGSTPAGEIQPAVVTAMAEVGISLAAGSPAFPKPLTDDVVQAADVVITMGCGDACPIYPGKRYLDWDLPDPAGADLPTVRAIRQEIDHRVRALIAELTLG